MAPAGLALGAGASPEAGVQLEPPAPPPAPLAQPRLQLQLQPIRAPGVLAVRLVAKDKMASAATWSACLLGFFSFFFSFFLFFFFVIVGCYHSHGSLGGSGGGGC